MKKYKVVTLGCKVNAYESEAVGNIFEDNGYVRSENEADVVIINTCSVTSTSDSKSRQKIRHEIASNPKAVICVMGCYSQVRADEVKAIDGVNVVIGTQYRNKLYNLVSEYRKNKKQIVLVDDSSNIKNFEDLSVIDYFSNTRAYLKIQDGCNNFCSYCIIPFTRGRVRSKDKDLIIKESNHLVARGYKELVLTGIHTGGYSLDLDNYRFADLLKDMVDKVKGIERIRVSSIEINELTDEVLNIMKNNKVFVNHLHIPLQSGCNETLKRMNRKYNVDYFMERIKKIKKNINDCSITTDVIVGFPNESEEEFETTCNNIRKIGFTKIHVFPFSSRSGTVASKMKGHITGDVKKQRVNKLIQLSKEMGKEYYSKFLDRDIEVLFETYDNDSKMVTGYSSNYLKVHCLGNKKLINRICKVRIKELVETNNDYEMKGEIVDDL